MRGATKDDFSKLLGRTAGRQGVPELTSGAELEVNVIFTGALGTTAALKTAGTLARNLGARMNLLAAQVVPYALPLDRPPIPVDFIERKLRELASRGLQGASETYVRLYLCRSKGSALMEALRPGSMVVIGGKSRWWRTAEQRLASMLIAKGHQVIFTCTK